MSRKSLIVVCGLVLSLAGIASARSYSFCLASTTKAGSVELKAGDYSVKVTGEQAVITDSNGKSVKIAVTIAHSDKKFESTQIETINKDGKDVLQFIDLEGSNNKLILGQ